jgi:methionyl-tRNA synthetase
VIKNNRERAATALYVSLRCIDDLKMMMTPFLPFTSQRLHEMLGYEGYIAGPLEFRQYTEEDGRTHRVLTGDYAGWVGRWGPAALPIGQKLREPKILFKRLGPEVVEEELGRLEEKARAG